MLTPLTPSGDECGRVAGGITGRVRAPWMRTLGAAVLAVAVLVLAGGRAWAQDSVIPLALPEGNLFAVGVGGYPDYIGSDDYSLGAIPLGRYVYWGKRDITLVGNTLNVSLLSESGWRLGPSGMLRFGRSDVADDVVDRVHEIDPSIDLGAFVGYTWVGDDPRKVLGSSRLGAGGRDRQPRGLDCGRQRLRGLSGVSGTDAGGRRGYHLRQRIVHEHLLRGDTGGRPGERSRRVPGGRGNP